MHEAADDAEGKIDGVAHQNDDEGKEESEAADAFVDIFGESVKRHGERSAGQEEPEDRKERPG